MKTKESVTKHGRRMIKLMREPKQWRLRVHENLGWFATLQHIPSDGLLTVSPGYNNEPRYHAMLSLYHPGCGDYRWTDNKTFAHPQKAVDHAINLAKSVVSKEAKALRLIDSIKSPAKRKAER